MINFEWDLDELDEFANNMQNISVFEKQMKKATKQLSKALLVWMKAYTPVDEYQLVNGWEGNQFAVKKVGDTFEVLIVNKTPYALAVNDGHKAYNQYGGPYPIKRRIKVRSPHQWQKGDPTYYVFGHFFVERGILRFKNSNEIEQIIMNQLLKWWNSL